MELSLKHIRAVGALILSSALTGCGMQGTVCEPVGMRPYIPRVSPGPVQALIQLRDDAPPFVPSDLTNPNGFCERVDGELAPVNTAASRWITNGDGPPAGSTSCVVQEPISKLLTTDVGEAVFCQHRDGEVQNFVRGEFTLSDERIWLRYEVSISETCYIHGEGHSFPTPDPESTQASWCGGKRSRSEIALQRLLDDLWFAFWDRVDSGKPGAAVEESCVPHPMDASRKDTTRVF